jgi:hypothetical protein
VNFSRRIFAKNTLKKYFFARGPNRWFNQNRTSRAFRVIAADQEQRINPLLRCGPQDLREVRGGFNRAGARVRAARRVSPQVNIFVALSHENIHEKNSLRARPKPLSLPKPCFARGQDGVGLKNLRALRGGF